MKLVRHSRGTGVIALIVMAMTSPGWSQSFDVTARAEITRQQGHSHMASDSSGDVVVWLTPTQKNLASPPPRDGPEYTLVQKDKKFTPHVLVVPTGSSIEFPNLDPFFHNVFSLFNGKRFDLGLYEAHSRRTVQFDREGISYIFCNIHPEMGAVVITLSTPYYGISKPDGSVVLHNVPPGSYRLNVWAENVANDSLSTLSRVIEISAQNIQLGTIHLKTTDDVMRQHKNKFGQDYPPTGKDPY
jgi:plastocyanin